MPLLYSEREGSAAVSGSAARAGGDLAEAPSGNTGLIVPIESNLGLQLDGTSLLAKSLNQPQWELQIHGVRASGDILYTQFPDLVLWLSNFLGEEIELYPNQPKFSGKLWQNSGLGANGLLICWNVESGGLCRVFVSVPGLLFERLGVVDSCLFVRGCLSKWNFGLTRFDFKIRDFTKTITPELCLQAGKTGNISGIRPESKRGLLECNSYEGLRKSSTTYLGSPDSDKTVCVYDAWATHRVDATDFELRLRDDYATHAAYKLVGLLEFDKNNCTQLLASFLLGSIRFIDKSVSDRPCRCPNLEWWQSFIDMVGTIPVRVPGRGFLEKSLQRTQDWLIFQVAPSLAALCEGLGEVRFQNFIESLVIGGKERISDKLKPVVTQAQKQSRYYEFSEELENCYNTLPKEEFRQVLFDWFLPEFRWYSEIYKIASFTFNQGLIELLEDLDPKIDEF